MADGGFDFGPPSKNARVSSPTTNLLSFDPETADLNRFLNDINNELPAELELDLGLDAAGPAVARMPNGNRRSEDTLQNNRHLSALLGMDVQVPRMPSSDVGDIGGRFPPNAASGFCGVVPNHVDFTGQLRGGDNWLPKFNGPEVLPPGASRVTTCRGGNLGNMGGGGSFLAVTNKFQEAAPNHNQLTNGGVHALPSDNFEMLVPSLSGSFLQTSGVPGTRGTGGGVLENGNTMTMNAGDVVNVKSAVKRLASSTNDDIVLPRMRSVSTAAATVSMTSPASDSTGQIDKGASGNTRVTTLNKHMLILQQLVLILHAHKCQQRERDIKASQQQQPCSLAQCQVMKNILSHMTGCSEGKNCRVPHCASSRQIIAHWRNCANVDCPICSPLRNGSVRKTTNSHATAAAPTSGPMSLDKGFSPKQATAVRTLPVNAEAGIDRTTMTAIASNSTLAASLSGVLNILSDIKVDDVDVVPGQDWRLSVTEDLRRHLAHKLVQAIFPTQEMAALKDPRMDYLVQYAKKVEGDMYEQACSREDYYHLLVEKIHKIQKDLEQKKLRRLLDQNGLRGAGGLGLGGLLPRGTAAVSTEPSSNASLTCLVALPVTSSFNFTTAAHCSFFHQIITHYKNCTRTDCPICSPFKNKRNNTQSVSMIAPNSCTSEPSSNSGVSDQADMTQTNKPIDIDTRDHMNPTFSSSVGGSENSSHLVNTQILRDRLLQGFPPLSSEEHQVIVSKLMLIMHAHNCIHDQTNESIVPCSVAQCSLVKNVLKRMTLSQVITHYMNFKRMQCCGATSTSSFSQSPALMMSNDYQETMFQGSNEERINIDQTQKELEEKRLSMERLQSDIMEDSDSMEEDSSEDEYSEDAMIDYALESHMAEYIESTDESTDEEEESMDEFREE